mmetsp:Transcript_64341/g.194138  ORF Transcript_64341/g.194138 Transcript_64341/m.194138 type:complete len:147 (+) Transcript_64341:2-442(+)
MFKFQEFLEGLIGEEDSAKDFMRIKGVLEVKGEDRMLVLQCIHMLKGQNFSKPWPRGQRESRIIFIGRGMQQRRQELTDAVMACVVQPLRFAVGARVQARTDESTYEPGRIIRHWDEMHPYRIKLDSGDELHAPMDEDAYIKAASK